jgi:hypothetical protein
MNLAKLFTNDPWEDFDALPLPLQQMKVGHYKEMYALYLKRYKKNSGILGGAPKKWTDEELENIKERIVDIMKTPEYKRRKDSREKDKTAYVILVEQLYESPDVRKGFVDDKIRNPIGARWRKEVIKKAKAIKERVDSYKKRT